MIVPICNIFAGTTIRLTSSITVGGVPLSGPSGNFLQFGSPLRVSEYALPTEAPEKSVDVGKALAVGPSGTIALESTDSRHVSVRDHFYRTSSTGTWGQGANISAAISSAQLDAKAQGKTIFIGRGLHLISQSIEFDYATAGDNDKTNTGIFGENESPDVVGNDPNDGTVIWWGGAAGGTMVRIRSRGVTVAGIAFSVAGGIPVATAVSIDKGAANAGTRCRVQRCQIRGGSTLHSGVGGLMTDGIVIGPTAGVNNLEYNVFEDLHIVGCNNAAIKIAATTGQSKHNVLRNCSFLFCKYGVETVTGNFQTEGFVSAGRLQIVFKLGQVADPVVIRGLDTEFCDRIIDRGAAADPWVLVLEGARISMGDPTIAADGNGHYNWIQLGIPGMLHVRNVFLDYAATIDPALFKVSLAGGDDANDAGTAIFEGCEFLSPEPYKSGGQTQPIYVHSRNNKYRTFTGPPYVGSTFRPLKTGLYRLAAGGLVLPAYQFEDHPNHGTFMPNTSAAPADTVAGGGRRYVAAGAFVYRGSSDTVTTLAPA